MDIELSRLYEAGQVSPQAYEKLMNISPAYSNRLLDSVLVRQRVERVSKVESKLASRCNLTCTSCVFRLRDL